MSIPAGPGGPTVPATRSRQQIMSGELNPGDQLATESELSAGHKVSGSTIRESPCTRDQVAAREAALAGER